MRIVVVLPAVPHPFGNTDARWFYVLLSELAQRGHDVVAIVATEESDERIASTRQWFSKHSGRLALHCHRLKVDSFVLRRKWRNLKQPFSEMLQDAEFGKLLKGELARGYDVLHLEQLSTGWLGLGLPRTVLNIHYLDCIDSAAWKKMSLAEHKARWQARRAADDLLHGINNIRLLTLHLKNAAEAINPNARYWVVPIALDPILYSMPPLVQEPVVGLIGSMHWEPSRFAAVRLIDRLWPLVKARLPEAKLYVAGWNATQYLERYSSQPDVQLASNLADPGEFFSQVAVMLYPLSCGSGMKVKVMESMAYGVPVVTTPEGIEGIQYHNGRECWVADSDEELAEKACQLLMDSTERLQMRTAARLLIEERYSPAPVIDAMISIYKQVINSP